MEIGLAHYLTVAAILFTLGILGIFLNRKNVIIILMSVELMLLAVNINLVAFSVELGDLVGQIFAMLVLTVAAAEAAIGLAILVVYFRNRGSIAVEDIKRIADRHGMDMIVEKIESEQQLLDLLDLRIDYGQGYLFGEPRLARAD